MEIKLLRTEKTAEHTLGSMYSDGKFFGYTIEPAHLSAVKDNSLTALAEGVYSLVIRSNPMSGTPCIKVVGKNVPSNASVRCCNTSSRNNPSITLVSDNNCSGDYKEADVEAWGKLFACIVKNKNVSLVII